MRILFSQFLSRGAVARWPRLSVYKLIDTASVVMELLGVIHYHTGVPPFLYIWARCHLSEVILKIFHPTVLLTVVSVERNQIGIIVLLVHLGTLNGTTGAWTGRERSLVLGIVVIRQHFLFWIVLVVKQLVVPVLVVEVFAHVRRHGRNTGHVVFRVVVWISAVIVVGYLFGVSYVGDGRRGDVRRGGGVVFWCALLDVEDLVLLFYVAVEDKDWFN